MTERDTLLSVQHLEVYYGGIHALHDISLNIAKGSIVSIIGACILIWLGKKLK